MPDIPINDVTPRNRYLAAGGETGFEYGFPIFDADHIVVQQTNPADLNNPVTLTRGVHYTVTGVNDANGGDIVWDLAAYPTGAIGTYIYTLSRQVPYERLNDYQFSGDFESSDVNADYDYQEMQIQQLNRDLQATVRLDITDELTILPIEIDTAANRMGRALTFNPTGDGLIAGPSAQDIIDAGPAADAAIAAAAQAQTSRNEAQIFRNEAQAAAAGMKRKNPARAATTGALPASTYANGSAGVGATLTANANGALAAQDGVTLLVGEALLVKNQAAPAQNGVYVVTQLGSGGTPWILTRQVDCDTWAEIVAALVTVMEGGLADIDFLCTSNNGGVMGTNAITWQQQNSVIGDGAVSTADKIVDGVITYPKLNASAIATTADIVAGTASKLSPADQVAPLLYSTQVQKAVGQAISASTQTTLTWDVENFDDANWHDNVTNPSRITVNFTGRVKITGSADYAGLITGESRVYILKNGTIVRRQHVYSNTGAILPQNISETFACVPGDYFEIAVISATAATTAPSTTAMTAERVK